MTDMSPISPAFEYILSDADPDARREAVIVYRPPSVSRRFRGRLGTLQQRLSEIRQFARSRSAASHQAAATDYRNATASHFHSGQPGTVEVIGNNVLPIAKIEITEASLPDIAANPQVLAILPNQPIHLLTPTRISFEALSKAEQEAGLTWGLQRLNIPKLWERSRGADINVGVLDTGVFSDHPALEGRVKKFVVIDPSGRRIAASPPFDAGQHGTHVCGTVAGGKVADKLAIGVAPAANLLVAAVLLGNPTLVGLLEAISWAIAEGADIVNFSLGFSYYEPLFAKIFEIMLDEYDVLPVVSIGNSSHGNTSSPGNIASALSVGSTQAGQDGSSDVAFYSSGASFVFPGAEKDSFITKPDLVAPGTRIFSCIPPQTRDDGTHRFSYMDGTSMAAPHVSGIAAALMGAFPSASARTIANVLKETSKHPQGADRRPDNRWGYGMVDPIAAMQALEG